MTLDRRSLALHGGLIALLFALGFLLPTYHQGNLARIMVLATYAVGYNVLFGYTGLLSLGHAMFFAAGMYGLGLTMHWGGLPAILAFAFGILCAAALSTIVALLALRTIGVAFMIVTLMFSQASFLAILYAGDWTRGDEGFVIQQADRVLAGFDLSDPTNRYFAALLLFGICLVLTLKSGENLTPWLDLQGLAYTPENICQLIEERISRDKHPRKMFFAYANTVATIDFAKKRLGTICHRVIQIG